MSDSLTRIWTIPTGLGEGPFTVVDRGPDGEVPVAIIPRNTAALAVLGLRGRILSVTEAARFAGVDKGVMTRWRRKHGLAASDGTRIDRDKLVTFLKAYKRKTKSKGHSTRKTLAGAGEADEPLNVHVLVFNYLRLKRYGATSDAIVTHIREIHPGVSESEVDRVLYNPDCFQLKPDGSGGTVFMIRDD